MFENRVMLSIESVIQRKLGYLKVPKAFRDIFGSPQKWPEVKNVSSFEDEEHVFLIYEFSKDEMNEVRKPKR